MNIHTNIKEIPTANAERAFAELREANRPKFNYEIISRTISDGPLMTPSPIVNFEKPVRIQDGEPIKQLSIEVSESEYEKIQKFFDFLGFFDSIDDMLRQFLLQPEMWYRFCSFMGMDGNPVIDFISHNKPDGFNWC